MRDTIIWNDHDLAILERAFNKQLVVLVKRVPTFAKPTRKYDVYEIVGASGKIYDEQYAWNEISRQYAIFFANIDNASEYNEIVRGLTKWVYSAQQVDTITNRMLLTNKGYSPLVDSFEGEQFVRLARVDTFEAVEKGRTHIDATVNFICRPELFYADGFTLTDISSGDELTNPSQYIANPFIRISGSGSGSLVIGDTTITISEIGTTLYIDSDMKDCFDANLANRNSYVTFSNKEFPVLDASNTTITFSGGITDVKIAPRWWTL